MPRVANRLVLQKNPVEFAKVGTVIESVTHPGPGWLECDGKTYNRNEYPALAALRPHPGLKFSTTDLSSQFALAPSEGFSTNLHATDTTLFYTFSTSGKYFRSTDGGVTWTYHYTPYNLNYRSLHKLTTGRLILTSSREGAPLYSDDDGISWTEAGAMPVMPALCIYCVDKDILFMMKQGDTNIYRTTDLINWTTVSLNISSWVTHNGTLWGNMLVSYQDSPYMEIFILMSDGSLGLDLFSSNLGTSFSAYEQPLKPQYLGYYNTPFKIKSILSDAGGWLHNSFFYQNTLNGSINSFVYYGYDQITLIDNVNLSSEYPLQIINNNTIIAFEYKIVLGNGLYIYHPLVSFDQKNFDCHYGIELPSPFNIPETFNNKIHYFTGGYSPNWINTTLVTLELDPLLFSVPGIKPKGDLKSYISIGQ